VPAGWKVGDKTGSGSYGTTNDVGVLWPPAGGGALVVAVYLTFPEKDAKGRNDRHRVGHAHRGGRAGGLRFVRGGARRRLGQRPMAVIASTAGPCILARALPRDFNKDSMSGHGFHVHGPHDHELEHAASGGPRQPRQPWRHPGNTPHGGMSMTSKIAVCTAVIATVGAIFSYMGGATQANAGIYKNKRGHQKTEASNQ